MIGDVVLVTGAGGFVGSHCIKQLIEFGYRVRGTVRDLNNQEVVGPLQAMFPTLELVQADLSKDAGWDAALRGSKYVLHVASPFTLASNDLDYFYPGAVDGTRRVLKAAKKAGVSHVVVTSSMAAVCGGRNESADYVFTESDWSNTDSPDLAAYDKSKTLAEKAAWEYHKTLTSRDKFKLTTICPGFIQGPLLLKRDPTSLMMVKRLMNGEMPACPNLQMSIVDVRDVARAHIEVLLRPEMSANKRYLLFQGQAWIPEIAQILAKEFRSKGYNIPTMTAPYPLLWTLSLMDKELCNILPNIGRSTNFNIERTCKELCIELRPLEQTMIEMAQACIDDGLVKTPSAFSPSPVTLAAAAVAVSALSIYYCRRRRA